VEWLEASVTVDGEGAEAVAEALSRYAHRGVVIEAGPDGLTSGPVVVRGYLPAGEHLSRLRRRIEEAVYHLGRVWPIPPPVFRPVEAQDWTQAWKNRFHVLHVTDRVVVRPPWRRYDPAPGELIIQLEPGQAFGTGMHPTTRMCLRALEDTVGEGDSVLDVGTGSGILAIAAAGLGAQTVLAVDNDPVAVEHARAAVAANKVLDRVRVVCGSLDQLSGSYDVVVANILARVVIHMLGNGLAELLAEDGTLIAAGILEEQAADVQAAVTESGLQTARWLRDGDWVGLVVRRPTPGGADPSA
jgi:ribosomal protein L11 methyltransferase